MRFFSIVLLGVFVFGISATFAQDTSSTTEKEDITVISTISDVKPTTSTVLPITTPSLAPVNNDTTIPPTTLPPPSPNTTTTSTTSSTTTTTTTTTLPPTTPTTEKPTTSTAQPTTSTSAPSTTVIPPLPPRPNHWSTTSFIGGIVFAFGLSAIGFVAWKFYKARNERNYHTL